MDSNNDASDLDVFDELTPKTHAPIISTPPVPSDVGERLSANLAGVKPAMPPSGRPPLASPPLSRPSPSKSLPPPPPSFASRNSSGAPAGTDAAALLAGSGRVAASLPPPPPRSAPPLRPAALAPPSVPPLRAGSLPAPSVPPPRAGSMPSIPSIPPPWAAAIPQQSAQGLGSLPPMTVSAMPEQPDPTARLRKPKRGATVAMLLVALLTVVGIGAGAFLLLPRTGALSVNVSGPNGSDLGAVDVYVDSVKVCASSPCSVPALTPGIHDVSAKAEGYVSAATKGVEITAGSDAKFEIELFALATGFKVAGSQPGITLQVDGSEVGPLPQTLSTLEPGVHALRFVGSDRYAPLTKSVMVTANKIEDLGEIELEVVKGLATFELVTEGMRVRLVPSEGDARELDEGAIAQRRLSIDLDMSKEWTLEACSIGHEFLELPISFAGGQAEKTFRVELVENASMDRAHLKSWCHRGAAGAPAPWPAPALGNQSPAKLSFNSIPPSAAVVLDGKPVGRTPMAGVVVGAGTHSVVFIHPEKGRKATSVTVSAGQNRGVGVRF